MTVQILTAVDSQAAYDLGHVGETGPKTQRTEPMAGDWMKVEKCTPEKPEIWSMADLLGIDPDAVFGKCFRIWSWFDDHTTDGYAPSITPALLDRKTGVTGFGEAMASVGWLLVDEGELVLPNFDRHCGKTAKNRALSARRMQKQRCASSVTSAQPEKRREEKRSKEILKKEYSEDFEAFWRHFPPVRKTKKPDAWKAWQELSDHDQIDALAAVGDFSRSPAGKSEFCPGPGPWLRARRWEDDRASWNSSAAKSGVSSELSPEEYQRQRAKRLNATRAMLADSAPRPQLKKA